ncbi:nucleotide-binding universal stress UspA family protein [Methylobacterium sp. PvP062]|uniref:universal stress protein n=1 Tax=Methylobacterium TaxID=407 RepID=UPI0008D9328F|nr:MULTISPECIES: universal stress protein [unclassified Methylobacterium]MBP2492759.1 nucleotide-binding universal stress UspA family protein [Methylobacterium sp. PvP105]MCX7336404.1 universal stress protein [Hyphomicrobiales bacterium]
MSRPSPSPLAGIRDILVGTAVEGEREEASSAIGYGLTLAKAAGAHLTVQSASWRLSGDDAWLGEFDYEGVSVVDRRLDELARSIAERSAGDAAQAGVVCTTEAPSLPYPEIVSRLATRARLYDLTVLDIGPRTYDLDREMVEKALFHSGRPVIAVPPGRDAFVARRIIVAWDGSAQAARAANDALPFLRSAEAVEIVSVGTEAEIHEAVPGAEFAPHLARHGVNVSVNDLPERDSVADTLRVQAGLFRADMIVMGAYRHSPTREYFFGGVTRSFLRGSPAALFLSR